MAHEMSTDAWVSPRPCVAAPEVTARGRRSIS
ncbi:MAG: hypothetical protein JWM74_4008, partial [Myxococcaceae bacterium]|nr:hypothetical protein [Myxococcaceae bacterium]